MKRLLRWGGFSIVLLVAAVALGRNALIKHGAKAAVKAALGLEIDIEDLDVGLFTSQVRIQGLRVSNPPGFGDAPLAVIPLIYVDYEAGSLFGPKPHFSEIAVEVSEVSVVKDAGGALNLNRIRADVAKAIADRDPKRERKAALRLAGLYARRPEQAWSVRAFRDHARDVHDAGELLALADREMVAPLDREARRFITRAAKRVATVTAMSPMALIAVTYVLIENLRLLRSLAALYGGRPGFFGLVRLAHLVFAHMLATGGVALTDDLLGQFLGQDILRRLSRRLGEGAFNGTLTARIGIAAIEVIRPLPYLATKPPRVRDVLGEVLRPMFGAGKA